MAKNHENRVYIVPTESGDRYVIAHTAAQAKAHVVSDYVKDARKATAMEVAQASSNGTRIETVTITGDDSHG